MRLIFPERRRINKAVYHLLWLTAGRNFQGKKRKKEITSGGEKVTLVESFTQKSICCFFHFDRWPFQKQSSWVVISRHLEGAVRCQVGVRWWWETASHSEGEKHKLIQPLLVILRLKASFFFWVGGRETGWEERWRGFLTKIKQNIINKTVVSSSLKLQM